MKIKFEMKGLDELQRNLKKLARKAEQVGGVSNTSLDSLLTPEFLSRHTNFTSVEELFEKGGFKVESQEDFEALPEGELDNFIAQNTLFASWQEMLSAALGEQIKQHFDS